MSFPSSLTLSLRFFLSKFSENSLVYVILGVKTEVGSLTVVLYTTTNLETQPKHPGVSTLLLCVYPRTTPVKGLPVCFYLPSRRLLYQDLGVRVRHTSPFVSTTLVEEARRVVVPFLCRNDSLPKRSRPSSGKRRRGQPKRDLGLLSPHLDSRSRG